MPGGFSNKPKILRGALVEYGRSVPPLTVIFQFNPEKLTRNRSLSFSSPDDAAISEGQEEAEGKKTSKIISRDSGLRKFHQRSEFDDLLTLRDSQKVTLQEETISFELRLDATDKLNDGDPVARQFGIAPQLATLELMTYPKDESLIGQALALRSDGFSFTKGVNPPMILFIWGRNRVLPVNITSMNITETEFSPDLHPMRATVAVNLTVIEGPNPFHKYSKVKLEAMSALNLAKISVTEVVIPG
jgi:hypothetical protein